LSGTVNIVLR